MGTAPALRLGGYDADGSYHLAPMCPEPHCGLLAGHAPNRTPSGPHNPPPRPITHRRIAYPNPAWVWTP